jgi:hypothetical protein
MALHSVAVQRKGWKLKRKGHIRVETRMREENTFHNKVEKLEGDTRCFFCLANFRNLATKKGAGKFNKGIFELF